MSAHTQSGQTLVALLAFMAIAISVTSAATMVTIASIQATSKYTQGQEALSMAETAAENAIIRLIRDPSYSGSETITLPNGTARIVSITGSSPKTIVAEGISGNFRRRVQVVVTQANNITTVTSWSEAP